MWRHSPASAAHCTKHITTLVSTLLMLLLQEEEQARGGAAEVVADLSEAMKVAEASSPAGTANGAGAAVEQAPAFPERGRLSSPGCRRQP